MAWHELIGRALGRGLAGAVVGLSLTGCAAVIGGSDAPDIYSLSAPRTVAKAGRPSGAQLLIPAPHAIAALDTENIAVVTDGISITYYGGAAWSDRVPKLLQRKVIETFQNSDGVRAVGQPGEGLLIDYQVALDIRSFQLDVDGQRVATVEFAAKIINDRNGRVLATRTFRAEAPASSDQTADAVAAIDRAAEKCLVDLVQWTLSKI